MSEIEELAKKSAVKNVAIIFATVTLLAAVVVFPTPPLWDEIATILVTVGPLVMMICIG